MNVAGRCELIDGEIHMMSPAGYGHGRRSSRIAAILDTYVRAHNLGFVFGAETGFTLKRNPDTVRAPDAAFIRLGREPEDEDPFFEGAPDLAVEVVSPSESKKEAEDKAKEWLAAGCRLVWVDWSATRSVTVHRSGEPKLILHENDLLDGFDVLPGFACKVSDVFA